MTDAEKAIFWERSGGHPDLDQSGNQLSNSGLLLVEAAEIQRARCTWRWHRHALSKGSVIENVSIYSSLLWINSRLSCCYVTVHTRTCTFISMPVVYTTNTLSMYIFSLTYKVLTTSQPSYLHNLISLQPRRCTRSSSVVNLSRPPTISSLKITDRSFRCASAEFTSSLESTSRFISSA